MIRATQDHLPNLPARQQREKVLDVIIVRMTEDRHVDAGSTPAAGPLAYEALGVGRLDA